MGSIGRRKLLFVPAALVALVMGTMIAGPTRAGAQPELADGHPDGIVACDGGAQQRALFRSSDVPTTIGENAIPLPLAGAAIPFAVPADRQVIVTFTGEAFLSGQSPVDVVQPVDSVQVTVLLDGVPMEPADDVTFNTDAGQYDALEACGRVKEGNHVIRVEWQLSDVDMNNNLTGTLETWTLHVEINTP